MRGCTIARADTEAKKKFTFRIWNSESMEAHYFSAGEEEEFQSWMTEITKGAVKQTATGSSYDDLTAVVYYYPKDYQPTQPQVTVEPASPASNGASVPSKPLFDLPGTCKGYMNVLLICCMYSQSLYIYT